MLVNYFDYHTNKTKIYDFLFNINRLEIVDEAWSHMSYIACVVAGNIRPEV